MLHIVVLLYWASQTLPSNTTYHAYLSYFSLSMETTLHTCRTVKISNFSRWSGLNIKPKFTAIEFNNEQIFTPDKANMCTFILLCTSLVICCCGPLIWFVLGGFGPRAATWGPLLKHRLLKAQLILFTISILPLVIKVKQRTSASPLGSLLQRGLTLRQLQWIYQVILLLQWAS